MFGSSYFAQTYFAGDVQLEGAATVSAPVSIRYRIKPALNIRYKIV